jgi:7-carboxy-7-deazaguanine synthase (Cx14CxxC type)
MYFVHKIFKTVQGEGAWTGRPAVFIRVAGCNLWSGYERDRAKAICKFCDTEFVGGTRMTSEQIVKETDTQWGKGIENRFAVITGGEPALQLDSCLRNRLTDHGYYVAIETNGTIRLKTLVDWKCVSPKARTVIIERKADELKFVYPQEGLEPDQAARLVKADYMTLSPMDGPSIKENTVAAAAYVSAHPEWRLGIQAHKQWGIP